MIEKLYVKDTKNAYEELLRLEAISSESNELYIYIDEFLKMLDNELSYIRVRGFRLLCMQAKWDIFNKIDLNISKILGELDDDLPTAVRQCLKALHTLLLYKVNLNDTIKEKLLNLDLSKYKETMQPLIKKDILEILQNI